MTSGTGWQRVWRWVVFAGVAAWVLTFVVLPRQCGMVDSRFDYYLLTHPRIGLLLGLSFWGLLLAAAVRSTESWVSQPHAYRVALVVVLAWAVFELDHSQRFSEWLHTNNHAVVVRHRVASVWAVLLGVILWAFPSRVPSGSPT